MTSATTRVGGAARVRTRRPAMPLVGWLALCVGCAVLLGVEYPPDGWFDSLARPSPALPDSTLGAIFATLLAFTAIAAWRIDARRVPQRPYALRLFLAQLALGFAWIAILFGGHALGAAVAVVGVLWLALVATVVAFSRLDRTAGVLMIPYLAWMTFVLQQCAALWTLN